MPVNGYPKSNNNKILNLDQRVEYTHITSNVEKNSTLTLILFYIPIAFKNENIFTGSTVSKSSFKLLTRKNLEGIILKSVQSKRKCFTEKGSWQGMHRGQSSPFSKNELLRARLNEKELKVKPATSFKYFQYLLTKKKKKQSSRQKKKTKFKAEKI